MPDEVESPAAGATATTAPRDGTCPFGVMEATSAAPTRPAQIFSEQTLKAQTALNPKTRESRERVTRDEMYLEADCCDCIYLLAENTHRTQ